MSKPYFYLSLALLGLQLGVNVPSVRAEGLPESTLTDISGLTPSIASDPVPPGIGSPQQTSAEHPIHSTLGTMLADQPLVTPSIANASSGGQDELSQPELSQSQSGQNQPGQNEQSPAPSSIVPASTLPVAPKTLARIPVSQLTDIDSRHWAAQALIQLSQRYHCLPSYFNKDTVLTRNEFADVLATCLQVINSAVAEATANNATQNDLAVLQRLQDEFKGELATLSGRVDRLETQVQTLQDQQFVKRTTLSGIAEFIFLDTLGHSLETQPARPLPGGIFERPENPNATFSVGNLFIDIDTKVQKQAFIRTELFFTNTVSNSRAETNTDMTRVDMLPEQSAITLNYLFYQTKFAKRGVLRVGPIGLIANHILPDMSPTQAVSRFGRRSPIYRPAIGPGFLANYQVNDWFAVGGGYTMGGTDGGNPDRGFFNGGQTRWIAQATLTPNPNLGFALAYSHFFQKNAISMSGRTGSRNAQAPFGESTDTSAHLFSLASNYRINKQLNIGGWVGYGLAIANEGQTIVDQNNNNLGTVRRGDKADLWNWALGLAINDVGRKGNQLGFVFGMPFKAVHNDFKPFEDTKGTSYHAEAYYVWKLNPRFTITPGVFAVFNPEHNSSNNTLVVGIIRSTMRF